MRSSFIPIYTSSEGRIQNKRLSSSRYRTRPDDTGVEFAWPPRIDQFHPPHHADAVPHLRLWNARPSRKSFSRSHVQRDWTCLARAAAATEVRPAPCIIGLRLRWSSVVFTFIAVSQSADCSSSTFSSSAPVCQTSVSNAHLVGHPVRLAEVDRWKRSGSSAPGPPRALRRAPRCGPYFPTAVVSTPDPLRTPGNNGRAQPREP